MPLISEDLVRFTPDKKKDKTINLCWGEEIRVVGPKGNKTQIEVIERNV